MGLVDFWPKTEAYRGYRPPQGRFPPSFDDFQHNYAEFDDFQHNMLNLDDFEPNLAQNPSKMLETPS